MRPNLTLAGLLLVGLLLGSGTASHAADEPSPPNIVMIISDDQGYGDFGFMGSEIVETPHLDRLAARSALFPNGYVPSSLCRPSLVTLLTGLFPHQHGVTFNDPPDKQNRQQAEFLIRQAPTLPRILAANGYRCLQTGKYWEGNHANAGFTEGMTHGDPKRPLPKPHPTLGRLPGRHGDIGLTIGRDGMGPIDEFVADCTAKETPFFVWYAPFMPHTPFTPPEKYREMYSDLKVSQQERLYYAMCTWFDDTCGKLVDILERHDAAEDTLILFVVDNGWITNPRFRQVRGEPPYAPKSKRSPNEWGVRSPIFVTWPGKVKAARYDDLVSSIDLVPTALAAAGLEGSIPDLPGVNLLPRSEGGPPLERDTVFGEIFTHDGSQLDDPAADLLYRWARHGKWKLIAPAEDGASPQLYDVTQDPFEETDVAGKPENQAVVDELMRRLDAWWGPAT